MEWIESIPVWLLCLLIFGLRICDVTLGTVRTVAIVKGYLSIAVALGFFEVLIWILAVSQVIVRINESIFLALAFAGGFAAGNAVGAYATGELAYVRVEDWNVADPNLFETVTVSLGALVSGDSEDLFLTETGKDTHVFEGAIEIEVFEVPLQSRGFFRLPATSPGRSIQVGWPKPRLRAYW